MSEGYDQHNGSMRCAGTAPHIAARDRAAAAKPGSAPMQRDEARSAAMARIILKRVGIVPLLSVVAVVSVAATLMPNQAVRAQPVTIRATARAVILPSSVRVDAAGRVDVNNGGRSADAPRTANIRPTISERACDRPGATAPPPPRTDTAAAAGNATPRCRLIVADMP